MCIRDSGFIVLRFVQLLVGIVVAAGALAGFTLYLSHGPLDVPEQAQFDGLSADARIDWFDDARPLRVVAATDLDAIRALGFALAADDVWTMLVWRQAARGRLAEWLGPGVLPQDRHVRQLGIARDVDRTAAALDDATRRRLDAFCAGINAALATRRVRRNAQATLLGVSLDPWTPGDVVAAERLAAWVSSEMPESPSPSVPLDAVGNADARLRALLATDGLGDSRTWSFADDSLRRPAPTADPTATDSLVRDGPDRRLVATFVTGQQATPFLRAVEVRVGDDAPRLLVLLPGTPFPVAGARLRDDGSATEAWAMRPRAVVAWTPIPTDAPSAMVAERMSVAGGQEAVLYAPRVGGTTAITARPPPVRRAVPRPAPSDTARASSVLAASDTARTPSALRAQLPDTVVTQAPASRWRVAWTGERPGSDAAAWFSLWNGRPAPMRLVRLSGLIATPTGTQAVGAAAPHRRGLVVADSLVRTLLAARLDRLDRLPPWPTDDAVRLDARAAAQALVGTIDERRFVRPIERTAYDILRNWDGSYDANSIGATLFESISLVERATRGRDAFAAARDTAYFGALKQTVAFQTAVQRLIDAYGVAPTDWRRGAALPQAWREPFWGLPGLDLPSKRRHAPLDVPGGGHPLTLDYGPTTAYGRSSQLVLDLSLTPGMPVRLRQPDVDTDRFLGRYRASLDLLERTLAPRPPAHATALVPR